MIARYLTPHDDEIGATAAFALGQLGLTGLWVKSARPLADILDLGSVAVIGSRSATAYGAQVAADLASDLASGAHGPARSIVSGGAFGIDAAAHRGAFVAQSVVGASTVAVLACGINRVYPSAHAAMFDAIAERGGALVSTYDPDAAPTKTQFLERNRLIAALSQVVVVVEAAIRSGAMNTTRHAADLGRPVAAFPGPVTSAASQGCHDLIRSGTARLVTCARDVQDLVGT